MAKPILIRPTNDLARRIREAAKSEDRKPGPMVLILLERYFISQPQPQSPAEPTKGETQ